MEYEHDEWLREAVQSWTRRGRGECPSPLESVEEQKCWQKARSEKLGRHSLFWLTPNRLRDMGKLCPFPNGYSSEFAAGEALRNAVKDGLGRVGPQVLLLVAEFLFCRRGSIDFLT